MCGIAGFSLNSQFVGSFPVEKFTKELLLGIENRGRHATGMLAIANNDRSKNKPKIICHKAPEEATKFVQTLGAHIPRDTKAALLHTRFATQGDAKNPANNHPVNWNSCFAVHNGHIDNDDALVEEMIGAGNRVGEVDSFAIPATLYENGYKNSDELKNSLEKLEGLFAIAMMDPIKYPNEVILARGKSSPLWVLYNEKGIFWASTKHTLETAWGKCLGTPTKGHITDWDKSQGFYYFNEGEWLRFKQDQGVIAFNRFTPKERPWTTFGRRFAWTCTPTAGGCIFGDDCKAMTAGKGCQSSKCRCSTDNVNFHPRLNRNVNFHTFTREHKELARQWKEWGLTREIITRAPLGPTTNSSLAAVYEKCDFCGNMRAKEYMLSIIMAGSKKKKCRICQNAVMSNGEVLATLINHYEDYTEGVLERSASAIQDVAEKFSISETLVEFMVFHQTKIKATEGGQWGPFQHSVRAAYYKTMNEMKEAARLVAGARGEFND